MTKLNEPTDDLSDEALDKMVGGSIGSFLTQLGSDIKDMLSTGGRGMHEHGNGCRRNSGVAGGVA